MAVGHPHHTKAERFNIAEDRWEETEDYSVQKPSADPVHPK